MKQCVMCGRSVDKAVRTPAGILCLACLQKAPKAPQQLPIRLGIDDSPIIGQKILAIDIGGQPLVRAPMNGPVTKAMSQWINSIAQMNYEIEQYREDILYLMKELGRSFPPAHINQPNLKCSECTHFVGDKELGGEVPIYAGPIAPRQTCELFSVSRTPVNCLAFSMVLEN